MSTHDGILGDPRPLMPTLPGKATGIVGVDPMVLQCHDCGATLTQPEGRTVAVFIVTSGWHFQAPDESVFETLPSGVHTAVYLALRIVKRDAEAAADELEARVTTEVPR